MRGTCVDRSQHSPSRIIPHRGQVSENNSKPPNSEHWAVLHERVSGLYLANDPGHFGPQSAPLSGDSGALSGGADILAGESPAHDVNESSPGPSVEGADIIPDREPWQDPVALALEQDFSAVRFNLDSTYAGMAEKDSAEDSSPCSSKKM